MVILATMMWVWPFLQSQTCMIILVTMSWVWPFLGPQTCMTMYSCTHIYAIPASYTIQGAVSYMSFYGKPTNGTPFSSGTDLLWTCLLKYATDIFTDDVATLEYIVWETHTYSMHACRLWGRS